jgi:hypothetical protein
MWEKVGEKLHAFLILALDWSDKLHAAPTLAPVPTEWEVPTPEVADVL